MGLEELAKKVIPVISILTSATLFLVSLGFLALCIGIALSFF